MPSYYIGWAIKDNYSYKQKEDGKISLHLIKKHTIKLYGGVET
jgi:hypothetical protein